MTGTRSDVAVVVVTHDTRDEVLGCLATLPTDTTEVVVVDTGSRDGTARAVREAFPTVRVLQLTNAGYGRGANAGVRATSAPAVVVCNADVRFPPDAPSTLAAALRDTPGCAVVGPRVIYPDGRPQASARAVPDAATAIGHALLRWIAPRNRWTVRYRRTSADPTRPADVGWVSGCALVVRRSAFDAVEGFDPGYPLYLEDVDLAARLADAGWRVRFEPCVTVLHRVGASTSNRRWRTLVWHAQGIDRFVARRYVPRPLVPVVRPALRVVLAGWVATTAVAERTVGRRRSTTGE